MTESVMNLKKTFKNSIYIDYWQNHCKHKGTLIYI